MRRLERANRQVGAVKASRSAQAQSAFSSKRGVQRGGSQGRAMRLSLESLEMKATTGSNLAGTVPAVAENPASMGGPQNQR